MLWRLWLHNENPNLNVGYAKEVFLPQQFLHEQLKVLKSCSLDLRQVATLVFFLDKYHR